MICFLPKLGLDTFCLVKPMLSSKVAAGLKMYDQVSHKQNPTFFIPFKFTEKTSA